MESLLIACDFDGTITERDTLHLIVRRYGAAGAWESIEPRLQAGEVTLEEAMQEEFAGVRATPEQVRDLVMDEAGLRRGFRELVGWAEAHGHRLVVLSSGFRTVIDALLGHWGLAHLDVRCNDARFSPEGCRLEWAYRGELCGVCGRRCKRHDLGLRRAPGQPVVYVGDGVSDRCAAGMADLVFARADLARHLRADGVPFEPFEDFVEVRERLERSLAAAA